MTDPGWALLATDRDPRRLVRRLAEAPHPVSTIVWDRWEALRLLATGQVAGVLVVNLHAAYGDLIVESDRPGVTRPRLLNPAERQPPTPPRRPARLSAPCGCEPGRLCPQHLQVAPRRPRRPQRTAPPHDDRSAPR